MRTRLRLLSSLGAILLAASGVVAGGALPATASPTKPINNAHHINSYVALGDSFAAGQGAGPYLNRCLQSTNGYPALLDAVKGINLLSNEGCSGATSGDVLTRQLSTLSEGTTLVTLTVGGNDLNVAGVAAICATAPPRAPACTNAISKALAGLQELSLNLAKTYAGIAAGAPNAQLLVTGYPYLFETTATSAANTGASVDTLLAINKATDLLNGTIEGVARLAKSQGANIRYVDVTAKFAGHGIGSAHPWLNSLGADLPDVFHPNAAGYVAYARAVRRAVATNCKDTRRTSA